MDPLPGRSGGRKTSYRYADVGLQFAATIGVFTYGGYLADSALGTRPWFLILGVFLGFGLGMISMLSKINKLSRADSPSPPKEASDQGASDQDPPGR